MRPAGRFHGVLAHCSRSSWKRLHWKTSGNRSRAVYAVSAVCRSKCGIRKQNFLILPVIGLGGIRPNGTSRMPELHSWTADTLPRIGLDSALSSVPHPLATSSAIRSTNIRVARSVSAAGMAVRQRSLAPGNGAVPIAVDLRSQPGFRVALVLKSRREPDRFVRQKMASVAEAPSTAPCQLRSWLSRPAHQT
jgi:hypothetical protein